MAENNVAVSEPENQNEESVSNNQKAENKTAKVLSVYETMAKHVSELARTSDKKTVQDDVAKILNTIAAMNATEEDAIGIRVGDTLYRFSEYEGTQGLGELLVAGRVVLSDVVSARNKAKNDMFKFDSQRLLDPSQFTKAVRKVCSALRINASLSPFSKPNTSLLADSNKYAVYSGKVEDRQQPRIVFIQGEYDAEKAIRIDEWMIKRAMTLFI